MRRWMIKNRYFEYCVLGNVIIVGKYERTAVLSVRYRVIFIVVFKFDGFRLFLFAVK